MAPKQRTAAVVGGGIGGLALLCGAAGEGAVAFGERIADIRSLDGSYDVVVAADGLNSAARTALFGPVVAPGTSAPPPGAARSTARPGA
ncbi:hypothetical protein [Streptomyces inhibens]|uniref:hypothetical protein n=1 Tax=Streptomyces inhibens TaxID=2293571 RepID=UPI001EE706B7|nr:hypothetical protein [Streptomyces inhibens]UKY53561.1 hypothetical protein KI385_35325 [Streptomyces inhibens]